MGHASLLGAKGRQKELADPAHLRLPWTRAWRNGDPNRHDPNAFAPASGRRPSVRSRTFGSPAASLSPVASGNITTPNVESPSGRSKPNREIEGNAR